MLLLTPKIEAENKGQTPEEVIMHLTFIDELDKQIEELNG
jgi:hypothetical protein